MLTAATSAKVIDAANFKSLQAALDAVPADGALVKLPPGKFELAEPLRVNTEDTRLEGAGTATHLINKNEKGELKAQVAAQTDAKAQDEGRIAQLQRKKDELEARVARCSSRVGAAKACFGRS